MFFEKGEITGMQLGWQQTGRGGEHAVMGIQYLGPDGTGKVSKRTIEKK